VNGLMERLYDRLRFFVESRLFKGLMSTIILLNPVALAPQVWVAITAPSIEGLSLPMFVLFTFIQCAFVLNSVRTKDAPVFFSMLISTLETVTIIVTIVARS